jgi:hypothetical protein
MGGKGRRRAKTMTLGSFEAFANECLGKADEPEITLGDTVDAAKALSSKIGDIKEGRLEVKPPLSLEDINSYEGRAQTIISVGEKASQALIETEAPHQAAAEDKSASGVGGLVKS